MSRCPLYKINIKVFHQVIDCSIRIFQSFMLRRMKVGGRGMCPHDSSGTANGNQP